MDIIKKLSAPLPMEEVELRISNINKGGYAEILVYKTARADVKRLNDVCGINWCNRHFFDEKEHLCCGISIYNGSEWVERIDVGTESNVEKDKGNYSDSFKRAGFRWGIGLELYRMPRIKVKLDPSEFEIDRDKVRATFKLNVPEWSISYDVIDGVPINIVIKDEQGKIRYGKNAVQPKSVLNPPQTLDMVKKLRDEINIYVADNGVTKEMFTKLLTKKYADMNEQELMEFFETLKSEVKK